MTQEFVTLPREVVKRVMDALYYTATTKSKHPNQWKEEDAAMKELRAALEQPQIQSGGIPPNWKLVPMEPTRDMLTTWIKAPVVSNTTAPGLYRSMLSAAPHPPTTEESSVAQPQANQPAMAPIAQRKLEDLMASGYTISGYSVYHEQKHQHGFVTGAGLVGWWKPEGVEYPQPRGEQEPVAWAVMKDGEICWEADYPFSNEPGWCDSDRQSVPLYTNPQNLNCKSNQARLATLWGYVKSDQQPQVEQEPVAEQKSGSDMISVPRSLLGAACSAINRKQDAPKVLEQLRRYTVGDLSKSSVVEQPKREPLTDKQISRLWSDAHNDTTDRMAFQVLARAIEAAHNIK